jgi:predicted Fe-Mo cluster-binding NifX family protein
MKIAISATSNNIDAAFDPRFGRAVYFIIFDTESEDWQAHPNAAANASGGAGIQAAQFVANQGAEAIISGDFGPNAYQALSAAGVRMFVAREGTVAALVEQFKAGQLQEAQSPTRAFGLHGQGRGQGRR